MRSLVGGEIGLERFEMRQLGSLRWEFSTKVFQILPNTKAQAARDFGEFSRPISGCAVKKFTGEVSAVNHGTRLDSQRDAKAIEWRRSYAKPRLGA